MTTRKVRAYPAPTPEQRALLRSFAATHGTGWKARLEAEWMRGSAVAPLHRLRNTHGPAWLATYELPAVQPEPAPMHADTPAAGAALADAEEHHAALASWAHALGIEQAAKRLDAVIDRHIGPALGRELRAPLAIILRHAAAIKRIADAQGARE